MLKLDFKNSDKFLAKLAKRNLKVYFVGGCVRDLFLNKDSKDIDLIVPHISIEDLAIILEEFGKVDLVGKSFGVLKFKPEESVMEYDISVPRTEVSKGEKHKDFDVVINTDLTLEDDLRRRDFTINALAMDTDGKLYDYFNGVVDLLITKEIRIITEDSFKDDPLRILRALQFSARFDLKLSSSTLRSLIKNMSGLSHISKERIRIEFVKAMKTLSSAVNFIKHTYGVVDFLFPENKGTSIDICNIYSIPHNEKLLNLGEFLFIMGISLKDAKNIIELTKEDVTTMTGLEKLAEFIRTQPTVVEGRKFIFRLILKHRELLEINSYVPNMYSYIYPFLNGNLPTSFKDIDVNGEDLQELGFSGIEIGKKLFTIVEGLIEYGNLKESFTLYKKLELLKFVK